MATISSLPRLFTLKYNVLPYLSITKISEETLPTGFVRFEEDQILSPRVKFAAEPSRSGDSSLINIRSCYNNKYWVAKPHSNNYYIIASADKTQEDPTKPDCTLFQAQQGPRQLVVLYYVARRQYLILGGGGDDNWRRGFRLHREPLQDFDVVDWESLMILPPHVTFRSEALEGNYLCSRLIDGVAYLRFEPAFDARDLPVAHELSPTNDGKYYIKSLHLGENWRRTFENWILADGIKEGASWHWDHTYSFVKISENVFAIQSERNNGLCGGLTRDGRTNCLSASFPLTAKEARLIIEERVVKREILDLQYRLSDSRIYDQEEFEEVAYTFTTNSNPEKETPITISYTLSDSRTTKWANNMSFTFGVKVNFESTLSVPIIENGEVKLLGESSAHTYEWGVAETNESTRQETYTVVVPPLTTMKVMLMRTKGACDVGFSYTQRDLLTSGETVTTVKDDGTFTGINSYYHFESSVQGKND